MILLGERLLLYENRDYAYSSKEIHTYPVSTEETIGIIKSLSKKLKPWQTFDTILFIAINHLPHTYMSRKIMSMISTFCQHGLCWVVADVITFRRTKDYKFSVRVLATIASTDLLVEQIIKKRFRRRRPYIKLIRAMVVGRKPNSWSFPSGHSTLAFVGADLFARKHKKFRKLFYGFAALVGFSRIYLGFHYPSDVLIGAGTGIILSRLSEKLANLLGIK